MNLARALALVGLLLVGACGETFGDASPSRENVARDLARGVGVGKPPNEPGNAVGTGGESGGPNGDAGATQMPGGAGDEAQGGSAGGLVDGGQSGSGGEVESGPLACPVGSIEVSSACQPSRYDRLDSNVIGCRVKSDGTLWCWGQDGQQWPTWQDADRAVQVGMDSDWTSISVGTMACGLRGSGTLWCFGYWLSYADGKYTTQINEAPTQVGSATWKSVSVGDNAVCGIQSDGTLWCWGVLPFLLDAGGFRSEPTLISSDTDWAVVTTAQQRACAIKTDGSLYCIGDNTQGALGDGTTTKRDVLTRVAGGGAYTNVAIGGYETCGLRTDGRLWCWGHAFSPKPAPLGAAVDWVQVAGHGIDVCALNQAGKVWCFRYSATLSPIGSSAPFVSLGTGCAESADHTAACWGPKSHGSGTPMAIMTPTRVGSDVDWVSTDTSWQWHVGLHTGGRVSIGSARFDAATSWAKVVPASRTKFAIRSDGALFTWTLSPQSEWMATQVGESTDWLDVATTQGSYDWACGIRAVGPGAGTLWCMEQGAMTTPFQFGSESDWQSLSGGGNWVCGVRANGSLWCWNLTLNTCASVFCLNSSQIGTDLDWASVSAGTNHFCALKTDGSLWCWGSNSAGALGQGNRTDASLPVQVAPGTTWSQVTVGWGDVLQSWTCGIQTQGSLWCWGSDDYGQLGLGAPGANRLTPQQVGPYKDFTQVAASKGVDTQTCAIRQGELWCMGQNDIGGVTLVPSDLVDAAPVIDDPTAKPFCPYGVDADYDAYLECLGDCNDSDPNVNPFAGELCNGIDDNCDGQIDEGCP